MDTSTKRCAVLIQMTQAGRITRAGCWFDTRALLVASVHMMGFFQVSITNLSPVIFFPFSVRGRQYMQVHKRRELFCEQFLCYFSCKIGQMCNVFVLSVKIYFHCVHLRIYTFLHLHKTNSWIGTSMITSMISFLKLVLYWYFHSCTQFEYFCHLWPLLIAQIQLTSAFLSHSSVLPKFTYWAHTSSQGQPPRKTNEMCTYWPAKCSPRQLDKNCPDKAIYLAPVVLRYNGNVVFIVQFIATACNSIQNIITSLKPNILWQLLLSDIIDRRECPVCVNSV